MVFQFLMASFLAFADCQTPTQNQISGPKMQLPKVEQMLVSSGFKGEAAIVDEQPLRLLVWNIYKGAKSDFFDSAKQLLPEYDFVLLQEAVYEPSWFQFHCKYLAFDFDSAIGFWQRSGWGTGVSTGSVYKSKKTTALRTKWREPFVKTPKTMLINEYEFVDKQTDDFSNNQGKRLVKRLKVVNLHGINFVVNDGFRDQLEQLSKALKDFDGALIIAGDFNTHNSGRTNALNAFAKRLGLSHVKFANDHRSFVLDHVYVRGVELSDARVLNSYKGASDHLPLSLDFLLR